MSDFVRIPVGRGTPEGVNSAYVVPDSGVVIDPGPPTDSSWSALRDGIERTEISVQGIDHVLVTHWHADHAGLACRLADRANASIHLHEGDAHLVGDYTEARQRRLRRDASILGRWGVPERIREALLDRDAPSPLPDTYPVQAHEEGDRIAGIEVVHTPGHTKGHVSFATAETLFLGDVLLPTYTPNVGEATRASTIRWRRTSRRWSGSRPSQRAEPASQVTGRRWTWTRPSKQCENTTTSERKTRTT
ncbi:MBL fold metallo-hydrolase [Natronoarchaeum sp. GCM10025703]|uniref:MBL fold metallo-hydrolase n=1 Tax=Natronoarchaeum sp. GCM10025703 TaxID=3252685 RepID=UPI003615DDB9